VQEKVKRWRQTCALECQIGDARDNGLGDLHTRLPACANKNGVSRMRNKKRPKGCWGKPREEESGALPSAVAILMTARRRRSRRRSASLPSPATFSMSVFTADGNAVGLQ
jgi:hypothetical protein